MGPCILYISYIMTDLLKVLDQDFVNFNTQVTKACARTCGWQAALTLTKWNKVGRACQLVVLKSNDEIFFLCSLCIHMFKEFQKSALPTFFHFLRVMVAIQPHICVVLPYLSIYRLYFCTALTQGSAMRLKNRLKSLEWHHRLSKALKKIPTIRGRVRKKCKSPKIASSKKMSTAFI